MSGGCFEAGVFASCGVVMHIRLPHLGLELVCPVGLESLEGEPLV
jgi:hypothetical protein